MGLSKAGWDVRGVDLTLHKGYPFELFVGDALSVRIAQEVSFVWASPPCQAFTCYRRRPGHVRSAENLIGPTRDKLRRWGGLYCIENVPGAPLLAPFQLCGSSFGLDIRRHRIFECNFDVSSPPCEHGWQSPRFAPATNRRHLRRTVEVGVWRIPPTSPEGRDADRVDGSKRAQPGRAPGVRAAHRTSGARISLGPRTATESVQ
jgi:DNA (cytosine-5)-methyltransferase 1